MSINRLAGAYCYVCGPIDRCPDGGVQWREWITPELNRRGIIVLDPLNKPFDVGLEQDDNRAERKEWKETGQYDRLAEVMRKVRQVDLRLVDYAHFLIVKLDLDVHMAGTYEELFLANKSKRPILIWCPQGIENIPDWVFGVTVVDHFFNTLNGVLEYIDHVATAPEVKTYKRWLFLRPKQLYTPEVLAAIAASV